MKNKIKTKSGFTLVEMAIVLVIIGLVVSSVMVGKSLVRSAAIRSTIAQVDSIRSSTAAFKGKYDGVPGDLLSQRAKDFGLAYDGNYMGGPGKGDGDGVIMGCGSSMTSYSNCTGTKQRGETALFWIQLKGAGFIQGGFTGIKSQTDCSSISISSHLAVCNIETAYIRSKLNEAASYVIYSTEDRINVIGLTKVTSIDINFGVRVAHDLSASEVYQIDKKIDDGEPLTGGVKAMGQGVSGNSKIGSIATNDVDSGCVTSDSKYNLATTDSNCSVQFNLNN